MTDRELLELAAKAAGIKWVIMNGWCGDIIKRRDTDGGGLFAPLTDDGDALRLAVKLEIDIQHNWGSVIAIYSRADSIKEGVPSHLESPEGYQERMEATRRAIVRAAAEIGKKMK